MPINNKCKNCGGSLLYDPETMELKCDKCDSIEDIPDEKILSEKKSYNSLSTIKQSKVKYTQYKCLSCERINITPIDEKLQVCPSCGSSELKVTSAVEFLPDGIKPFKLNKEKALEGFFNWLKKRKFAPNNLKTLARSETLKGSYVPIYNYDFLCISRYSGVGINYHRDSKGIQHKTTSHFSDTNTNSFQNYMESASSNISSRTIRSIGNYDLNSLLVYRPEYLYGQVALQVNIDLHDNMRKVKSEVSENISNEIQNHLHYDEIRHFQCETKFENVCYNYLYVPMYINTYSYKNKLYTCYINGETGKISGKTPKSFWKIFSLALGIVAIIGLIVFLATKLS